MSLHAAKGRLSRQEKELLVKWEAACSVWRDSRRDRFEKHCIEPLIKQVKSSLDAMDQMLNHLQKIRRDCEE